MNDVIILGKDHPCGAYLLRIHIAEHLKIRFGRFQQGSQIPVPRGEAIYIGSAMARSGSMTLARRTLRHATRSAPLSPHTIRPILLKELIASGLASPDIQPPKSKKPFWNIDYLLDNQAAHLRGLFLLRTNHSLENDLAQMLLVDPACRPIAPGLGAHDNPGSTHLLHVQANEQWWQQLLPRIDGLLHHLP